LGRRLRTDYLWSKGPSLEMVNQDLRNIRKYSWLCPNDGRCRVRKCHR